MRRETRFSNLCAGISVGAVKPLNNRPNGRFFCIAKKMPLFPREIRKKASFDH